MRLKTSDIKKWFTSKEKLYADLADKGYAVNMTQGKERAFIDRSSNVLLVAHIDTVLRPVFKRVEKGVLYAIGLDDRLGCYLADLIGYDLSCDVLICDHEEIGRSTAQYFDGDISRYNMIIELDRAGTDVVTYGMESNSWIDLLLGYWNVGYGSFSDICMMDNKTNICMANVGIGYHLAHDKGSYCNLTDLLSQYGLIKKFITENRNDRYEREYREIEVYDDFIYNDEITINCSVCNKEIDCYIYEYDNCDICGNNVLDAIDHALWGDNYNV